MMDVISVWYIEVGSVYRIPSSGVTEKAIRCLSKEETSRNTFNIFVQGKSIDRKVENELISSFFFSCCSSYSDHLPGSLNFWERF